jgi:mercuric ion transport protein
LKETIGRSAEGQKTFAAAPKESRRFLILGGLAAVLASTCCLGPLILVLLGVGGAWIGNLTALEPYRPISLGAALIALFFGYRRIFRPAQACRPGEVCAAPQVRTAYKALFWVVAALVVLAFAFPYVLPFFY